MKELEERKAIGPDGVSRYILKECGQEMSEAIFNIIVCSLKTGIIPKEWKRADMIYIYKNGNQEEPLNYTPVSLTSIACKILEQLSINKERSTIIIYTFWFRTERSCFKKL